MPYKSEKQRRWAHTPSGKEALGPEGVKEWDRASKGKDLPESAESSDTDKAKKAGKAMRKVSRDADPYKGKHRGGFHSTPKGDKGYKRNAKHKKSLSESFLSFEEPINFIESRHITRTELLRYRDPNWLKANGIWDDPIFQENRRRAGRPLDETEGRDCGDGSRGGESYPEKCTEPGGASKDLPEPPDTSYLEPEALEKNREKVLKRYSDEQDKFRPPPAPAYPESGGKFGTPTQEKDKEWYDVDSYLANNSSSWSAIKKAASKLGLHDEDAEELAYDLTSQQIPDYEAMEILQDHYMKKWEEKNEAQSQALAPTDETYRNMNFPIATIATLDWSTHKSETFEDTGKNGEHPAWGMKSIIDRGVRPKEKSDGAKRIDKAQHQTQKRNEGTGKKFKAFSMMTFFNW